MKKCISVTQLSGVYCDREIMADEVVSDAPVMVLDMGSGVIKAGWAGEDTPRFTAPAVVARVIQNTTVDRVAANFNEDLLTGSYAIRSVAEHPHDLELTFPIDRQEVTDWNAITQTLERLYSRSVVDELCRLPKGINLNVISEFGVESEKHPVVITNSPFASAKHREKVADTFFRHFRGHHTNH